MPHPADNLEALQRYLEEQVHEPLSRLRQHAGHNPVLDAELGTAQEECDLALRLLANMRAMLAKGEVPDAHMRNLAVAYMNELGKRMRRISQVIE